MCMYEAVPCQCTTIQTFVSEVHRRGADVDKPNVEYAECARYLDQRIQRRRAAVQMQIIENCGTHSMPGCEDCTAEANDCPNTLETLQSVCNAHSMEMCSEYNTMCSVNGDSMSHFCGSRGGTFDPPMRMYFHKGAAQVPFSI